MYREFLNKDGHKLINQIEENAKNENADFIFLNAWNEWAEWCYLEPDKKNGYGYLEAISAIKKGNA